MKKLLLLFSLVTLAHCISLAQSFTAIVIDSDTDKTALYQANVAVSKDNNLLFELKTYFDGKFSFKTTPNTTYTARISFPGRKDTTIIIATDKKGNAPNDGKKIIMVKDGMRLLGKIIDRENEMPIEAVGLVLKNVMTRKEDKIITGLDGAYNFRLDYETNYMLKIDRRSPGIFNRFSDTTLYISTVGFNLPLDYVLDIHLRKTSETITARPEYDPYKKPTNQILKPVVEVMGIKDSAKLAQQLKEVQALREQLKIKDSLIASYSNKIVAKNEVKTDAAQLAANKAAIEKQQAEEQARLNELKAKEEEKLRLANEKKLAEERERKLAEEKIALEKKAAEERAKKLAQEETLKALKAKEEEAAKLAMEKKLAEERAQKIEAEKLALEKKLAEERAQKAQAEKLALEKKTAEENALKEKKAREDARLAEEQRQKAEKLKLAEQERKRLEQARLEEELRVAAENKKAEEAAKALAEKQAREMQLAMDKKMEEQRQLAELKKQQEEVRLRREQERKMAIQKQQEVLKKRQEEDSLREVLHKEQLLALEQKIAQQNLAENRALQEKIDKENRERQAIADRLKAIEEEEKRALAEETRKLEEEIKRNRETYEAVQNDLMAYYENKIKAEQATAPPVAPAAEKSPTKPAVKSNNSSKADDKKQQATLTGKVISGVDNKPLKGVFVSVRNTNSIFSTQTETDDNGQFRLSVDNGSTYLVSYVKEGYSLGKQTIDLTNNKYFDYKVPDFYIVDDAAAALAENTSNTPVVSEVVSENVLTKISFSKNSYNFSSECYATMFDLLKALKAKPNSTIVLFGLAAKDEINAAPLSETRAKEVAKFLAQNGIKNHRISVEVLGETRPISKCGTIRPCTENDYKKDRVVLCEIR